MRSDIRITVYIICAYPAFILSLYTLMVFAAYEAIKELRSLQ